jgi:transcriptional regulator with XRE-family HTH domain
MIAKKSRASQVEAIRSEARLLQEIKEGFGLDNDAQIAAWLGISRAAISSVRDGRSRLGALQRLKVLDRLGFLRSRRLLESLLSPRIAAEVVKWSQAAAQKDAARKTRPKGTDEESYLLDVCKAEFAFKTDADLAEFLGVRPNTISMVRAGKSELGVLPRLRILREVVPDEPYAEVEHALASTEHMITLLKARRPQGLATQDAKARG